MVFRISRYLQDYVRSWCDRGTVIRKMIRNRKFPKEPVQHGRSSGDSQVLWEKKNPPLGENAFTEAVFLTAGSSLRPFRTPYCIQYVIDVLSISCFSFSKSAPIEVILTFRWRPSPQRPLPGPTGKGPSVAMAESFSST